MHHVISHYHPMSEVEKRNASQKKLQAERIQRGPAHAGEQCDVCAGPLLDGRCGNDEHNWKPIIFDPVTGKCKLDLRPKIIEKKE